MSTDANKQPHLPPGPHAPTAEPIDRTLAICTPEARACATVTGGFVDVLGDVDPTGVHPGQRLMVSRALPLIYERLWRPALGRAFMGVMGPGMRGEHAMAVDMLGLLGGERVLDVACGTGAFTRGFGESVGRDGLAVGLDASATMLERAVAAQPADNVAYVRGDACALPFGTGSFDAVCCFAALYLIEDPLSAIDEIVRVLVPGGRLALLTSVHRGPLPAKPSAAVVRALSGVRIFGPDELTRALGERGVTAVRRRVTGLAQFVSGRAPVSG